MNYCTVVVATRSLKSLIDMEMIILSLSNDPVPRARGTSKPHLRPIAKHLNMFTNE